MCYKEMPARLCRWRSFFSCDSDQQNDPVYIGNRYRKGGVVRLFLWKPSCVSR